MDTWVKIKSWHTLRPDNYFDNKTYCGLEVEEGCEVTDKLPDGSLCEKCKGSVASLLNDSLGGA